MSDFVVKDRFPQFSRNVQSMADRALGELSADILIKARRRTPFSGTKAARAKVGRTDSGTGGHLRMDSYPERMGPMKWQVVYNKEYAAAQEAGTDGKVTYRRYTTPGTGKSYLKTSGDEVYIKAINIIKKHLGRARP